MKLTRYHQFLLEQQESDSAQFDEVKSDLKEMIEKSLKTEDMKTVSDFIDAYMRNPEDTQIEGLINDSDIYEFYIKYRNTIDEMLSKIKFFEEKPSELESFSLYDYVVKGTKKAISEFVEMLK